jgi:aspartate/methionine/tyrosine aminotransferase
MNEDTVKNEVIEELRHVANELESDDLTLMDDPYVEFTFDDHPRDVMLEYYSERKNDVVTVELY